MYLFSLKQVFDLEKASVLVLQATSPVLTVSGNSARLGVCCRTLRDSSVIFNKIAAISCLSHLAQHTIRPFMDDHWRFLLLDWRKLICSYYQADQSLIIKRRVMQIKSVLHHMCPLKVSIWNSWLLVIERMQNVSKRQNSKTFCQLPSERHVRLT